MTPTEALQNHLSLSDELHQLALEENRFLKQHQRPPEAALLDRKRALLARLDLSLAALKAGNAPAAPAPGYLGSTAIAAERKVIVEKARARILQILHLDRENEQLLLRYSLGARNGRPAVPAPAASPSQLQKLYERHG